MADIEMLPPDPMENSPESVPNKVWFGADGLRAGWSLLLFFLLFAMVFAGSVGVRRAGQFLHPDPTNPAVTGFFAPLPQAIIAFFYILLVAISAWTLGHPWKLRGGKVAGLVLCLVLAIGSLVSLGIGAAHGATVNSAQKAAAAKQQAGQTVTFTPTGQITQEGITLLVLLIAVWIMSRVEDRRFGEYGFGGNERRWPQLVQGLIWGFASLSLLVLALWATHLLVFDGRMLTGAAIFHYGILWLIGFFLVGLFEEFAFRGYIQYTLARGIGFGAVGFWISALIWNFSFGFAHGSNPGESPIGLFTAGFIGFIFCLSLWYTRSLWWAVGFHATWDWGESYFYGTADSGTLAKGHLYGTHPQGTLLMSGGATGPEGSWFAIAACLFIAFIIWLTLRGEHNKSTNQALINPL